MLSNKLSKYSIDKKTQSVFNSILWKKSMKVTTLIVK